MPTIMEGRMLRPATFGRLAKMSAVGSELKMRPVAVGTARFFMISLLEKEAIFLGCEGECGSQADNNMGELRGRY
jgi:hypothetical protein